MNRSGCDGCGEGRRRGVTLLEVCVVMAVIAILAGIIVPTVKVVRSSARALQCQSNLREFAALVSGYAQQYRGAVWPGDMSAAPGNVVVWSDALLKVPPGRRLICPSEPQLSQISYMLSFCLFADKIRLSRPVGGGIPDGEVILIGENLPGTEQMYNLPLGLDAYGYNRSSADVFKRHGPRSRSNKLWKDLHVSAEPVVRYEAPRDSWWPN